MLVICSNDAVMVKYGKTDGVKVLAAVARLGTVVDVSGRTPTEIRSEIDSRDPSRSAPVCLVGGYDLVPTFRMANPTRTVSDDRDADVLTDAPYGARPDSSAEIYLPTRAVSRLPDGGVSDPAAFVDLLTQAVAAPAAGTPHGTYEHSAAEFDGSAQLVHGMLPGQSPVRLSPPDPQGMPSLGQLASGRGRLHVILHGADKGDGRSTLWGREGPGSPFLAAVKASDLKRCDLRGAIVTFSSCYAAMLDNVAGDSPRTSDNQVGLACLAAGAKVVYGPTRANWIDITQPFDSFAAALIARVWARLQLGDGAAEALRVAKWEYSKFALALDAWGRPYVFKTLLQAHCFGHPLAML